MSLVVAIMNFSIQNGLFDSVFYDTHIARGFYAKSFHNQLSAYWWLPVSYTIVLLNFYKLFLYRFVIGEIPFYLRFILRGNITFAQGHQVINIIAGIKK